MTRALAARSRPLYLTVSGRLAQSLRAASADSRLWPKPPSARAEPPDGGVVAIANDSRAVAGLERLFAATAIGWRRGAIRAFLVSVLSPFNALEPEGRVRALGWTVLVAVVTHVLAVVLAAPLTRMDLSRAAIGPLIFTMIPLLALLLLATTLLAGSRFVGLAWVDRTPGRRDRFADTDVADAGPGVGAWIEASDSEIRGKTRLARLVIIVASVVAVIVYAVFSSTQVSVQWTTVSETVPLSPRTASFVWTSRGGLLSLQSDRPTRFEISPAASARIISVQGTGIAVVRVNGATAVWPTDPSGHVTVVLSVDRPGPATLTATDVISGDSRTITFTAR